ncbi:hypothetical protein L1987_50393 [Smallanthus sonchifolius]|uniref:Uncharacterized protein n=1 Tax=Smallanthus sonchifolius TaxID=185202 RepID=A0ACB9EMG8_9ASTR|nr:hypothetical protein L1987_50393 [Smallanthus sonchifolius]
MGNFTSCFASNIKSARLIDVHGNLRNIKVPVTAAEIMLLEQPGYLVSPVADDLRSGFRLSALRADEALTNGKLYFLIPVGRLNSFVTETELEMLRSGCGNVKQVKRRRRSKVLPEESVVRMKLIGLKICEAKTIDREHRPILFGAAQ